jgi:hypothetical protein
MQNTSVVFKLRLAIFTLLILAGMPAFAKEIKTLEDFNKYNELHVQRVEKLGVYLFQRFGSDFPDLNIKLVREFLAQHDYPKLNETDIQKELFQLYGMRLTSRALQERRLELVRRLHQAEHEYAYAFFAHAGLLHEDGTLKFAALQLQRLEMIADAVDRYRNPLAEEEFARPMRPASEMPSLNSREQWLASKLEERYSIITRGLMYADNIECVWRLMHTKETAPTKFQRAVRN